MGKKGGFGGGIPGNMNNLMKQAQRMQRQMEEKQKELTAVTLSPEVVDPDDIEMLQDLIIAAANEALKKMEEEQEGMMNSVAGGLGSTLGGFGF